MSVQSSPPARATQKELVRLLVLQHGLQKASELSGVPYDLVRQWESRRQRKERSVTNVTNPVQRVADYVESELAENERETKLSLSRYARRAAKDSEQATLLEAKQVKAAAEVAGIVHRWGNQDKGGNQFTLNVLNVGSFGVTVGDQPAE